MIELKNIVKLYPTIDGANLVLDNINVRLPENRSLGIFGRNGAGKSTLLRIIGGAELPDSGRVVRKGKVSWPIGFSGGFSPSLTGEENCRFIARVYDQDLDEVVDYARDFADIGSYFYMPVRTYSSGMRARLAFGVSMAIDFDVYLVDEVTAVGDAAFKRKCSRAFQERRERSTLIMVSHSVQTLAEYCNLGAVLDCGKMDIYDSVAEAAEVYEKVSQAA
jgi:capsular polysaccharide transport system ATP-binding protein